VTSYHPAALVKATLGEQVKLEGDQDARRRGRRPSGAALTNDAFNMAWSFSRSGGIGERERL
jgi:hypothetical protein